jgi:hypothetical protein
MGWARVGPGLCRLTLGGVSQSGGDERSPGCIEDPLGGGSDLGDVTVGPAGDVGQGVVSGVQAGGVTDDVGDALGLDLGQAPVVVAVLGVVQPDVGELMGQGLGT